ncbi:hypothetical protein AAGW05_17705 [Arthrobacter sp. LAPM80]|uniref:hypothetical protein n=1 Tax=Arthrobacter sp. LAPM80 TaxID=3141788 RepID=UPI00398AA04C
MSQQEPQGAPQKPGKRTVRRGLRQLPGFTTAAIAFLVVVLLAGGGIAVAQWNQSATAVFSITAGAAPVPTPTPTPPPTVPPAASGNVVAAPVMDIRPSVMSARQITCAPVKEPAQAVKDSTAAFNFSWAPAGSTTSYVTSLTFSGKGSSYQQSQSVTGNQALYTLANSAAAFGLYILRIQPMNGGVAGDPIYRTFQHSAQLNANCYDASPDGQSPLGSFTANAAASENFLTLSWTTAAKATSYVVSIEQNDGTYGAELIVTTLGTKLTFPPRSQNGQVIKRAPYYGNYTLRILPMNGPQAGDPVYKTVQYQPYSFITWD